MRRATRNPRPSLTPRGCAAGCSWCTAQETTTCTTRARNACSTGLSRSASRWTSWSIRTGAIASARSRARGCNSIRCSRATVTSRPDLLARPLLRVNLPGHEEEVVTHAVQQDPGVQQPHAGADVAVAEREVAERPGQHSDQHDGLDAVAPQRER